MQYKFLSAHCPDTVYRREDGMNDNQAADLKLLQLLT